MHLSLFCHAASISVSISLTTIMPPVPNYIISACITTPVSQHHIFVTFSSKIALPLPQQVLYLCLLTYFMLTVLKIATPARRKQVW
jgi:hypothetical protein